MTFTGHPQEDQLLELAYGELPAADVAELQTHVHGCALCSEALSSIQQVRKAMAQLPLEQAPEGGMESLLAYAEQTARRMSAGPAPAARSWRRFLAPAGATLALAMVALIAGRVLQSAKHSAGLDERTEQVLPVRAAENPPEAQSGDLLAAREASPEEKPAQEKLAAKMSASSAPSRNGLQDRVDRGKAMEAPPASERKAEPQLQRSMAVRSKDSRATSERPTGGAVGDAMGGYPHKERASAEPSASGEAGVEGGAVADSAMLGLSASVAKAGTTGDRRREIVELRRALASDAKGTQRAELLNRLCSALFAVGEKTEAHATCDAVVSEFPGSEQAATALRLQHRDGEPASPRATPAKPETPR